MGMPRMRSASMPLLGFEETRISLSDDLDLDDAAGTARILSRPFRAEGADGARESRLQVIGSLHAGQSAGNELAQFALDAHAALALRTEAHVTVEIALLDVSQGAVEKEVDDAFHIVTDHAVMTL